MKTQSREQEVRVEQTSAAEMLEAKQDFIVQRLLELAAGENPNAALGALNRLSTLAFGKRVLVEKRGEEAEFKLEPGFQERMNQVMGRLAEKYGAT